MKLFNVEQIRDWDQYTIKNEPISSLDLMERAAKSCFDRIQEEFEFRSYAIICGPGNNGGDGLVLARYLKEANKEVRVFVPELNSDFSEDFLANKNRLPEDLIHYFNEDSLPDLDQYDCTIDALFGSGLTRPLKGFLTQLVLKINRSESFIISVDIPSGLYADLDHVPVPEVYVRAEKIYSFQVKKTSFFNAVIRKQIGDIEVLDIGLSEEYAESTPTSMFELTEASVTLKEVSFLTHKFEQGFTLIVGGSKGKYGAPVMAAKAALRSGAGLVSIAIPEEGSSIAHSSLNELMVVDTIGHQYLEKIAIPEKVNAIGVGPGLGINIASHEVLKLIFGSNLPMVLDADALNQLGQSEDLMQLLPPHSVLTPHEGEFKRLFGDFEDEVSKYTLLKNSAQKHQVIIVLKGAITTIADPDGNLYFSEDVGNPGMATAGSGDVLTGIIASFLAQGYTPLQAAINGVYIHGLAGDIYAEKESYRSLIATDLIQNISQALKNLEE